MFDIDESPFVRRTKGRTAEPSTKQCPFGNQRALVLWALWLCQVWGWRFRSGVFLLLRARLLFRNFLSKRRETVTLLFSGMTQKAWIYCYHTVPVFKMSISHCITYHPEVFPPVLL